MNEQIREKATELLVFTNQNLPTPGRVQIMFGLGKSMLLLFSDSTSKSLEESSKNNDPMRIKEMIEGLESGDRVWKDKASLEEAWREDPPISLVFQIMALTGRLCDLYFHKPDALKKVLSGLRRISAALDED